jgi:hypothetical protein
VNMPATEQPKQPVSEPLTQELLPTTKETCDRCGPGTQALFTILLPTGAMLTLCWHCATTNPKAGPSYVNALTAHTYLHDEEKKKGSDH